MVDDNDAVRLQIKVITPKDGCFEVGVGIGATAADLVKKVLAGLGQGGTDEVHVLQVPLATEDSRPSYHTLDPDERILDVVRGVQRPLRIVHESQIDTDTQNNE